MQTFLLWNRLKAFTFILVVINDLQYQCLSYEYGHATKLLSQSTTVIWTTVFLILFLYLFCVCRRRPNPPMARQQIMRRNPKAQCLKLDRNPRRRAKRSDSCALPWNCVLHILIPIALQCHSKYMRNYSYQYWHSVSSVSATTVFVIFQ